jgi:tyrosine-protein phosphatase SIW14
MKALLALVFWVGFQPTFAAGTVPENFFQVDASVLRGADPTQDNVDWLADHGVKTIIKLDDENMQELAYGIPVERLSINKFGLNLTYKLIVKILNHIEAATKDGKVYVHCEKGADRTGLIIALYRVKSGWSIDDARAEMNDPRFGHSHLQVWIDHKFEMYAARLASGP